MKWIRTVWQKIILEILVTVALWFLYHIGRKYLPKWFGIREDSIKKYMKMATTIISNVPDEEDTISSVLVKSKNIIDYLQEEKVKAQGIIETFKAHVSTYEGFEVFYDHIFTESVFPLVGKYAKKKETIMELDMVNTVVKYIFDVDGKEETVLLVCNISDEEYKTSYAYVGHRSDFDSHKLLEYVFNENNQKIMITVSPGSEQMHIVGLEQAHDADYKAPKEVFESISKEIQTCREKGYQRSYILTGPPGTGKTSFCVELSDKISGKVLKVDSNFFNNLQANTCKKIIQALKVEFLIVDDVDRIAISDMPAFLYMLETLKTYSNKPTLLATVNNIEKLDLAIIRPGRFDDIIEFDLPNMEERVDYIERYCKNHGIDIVKEATEKLAEATSDLSHAYIKEFCLQYHMIGDVERVIEKIEKRKKYLDMLRDDGYIDENVEALSSTIDEERNLLVGTSTIIDDED